MRFPEVLKIQNIENAFKKVVNIIRHTFIMFFNEHLEDIEETRNEIVKSLYPEQELQEEQELYEEEVARTKELPEVNEELIEKIKHVQNLSVGVYDYDGYEIEKIPQVISPTDEVEKKGSRRKYKSNENKSHNKLEILLNLFKQENIDNKDVKIYIGAIDNSTRRLESYILIDLLDLKKLVFLCELGGSTFVMDKGDDKDLDYYINLTKRDKLEQGAIPMSWGDKDEWGGELQNIIFGDKKYHTTFNISEEWENFCEVSGLYIGTVHAVATKVVREDNSTEIEDFDREVKRVETFLRSKIKEKNIKKEEVRDVKGHKRNGYVWGDLVEIIEEYKRTLKIEKGEDFVIDKDNVVHKSLNSIAKDNDITYKTIKSLTDKLSTKTRNRIFELFEDLIDEDTFISKKPIGRSGNLFSESKIVPIIKRYKSLPSADKNGEWSNFAEKNNNHFTLVPRIVIKLKEDKLFVNRGFIESLIEKNGLSSEWIITGKKDIKKAWNYEEIKAIVSECKPISKKKGEWFGFWTEGEKHFATVNTLSKKLGIKSLHHFNKLKQFLVDVLPITDGQGQPRDGYCIEEIYKLLRMQKIKNLLSNSFINDYPV